MLRHVHHGFHGDVVSNCSHWSEVETRCLIKIWREPSIYEEVRDTNSKHKTVYKRIAQRIAIKGYHRDESQIKNKIRMLTTNYRKLLKVKRSDRATYSGPGKLSFPYFNELHEFVDREVGFASGETVEDVDDDIEEGSRTICGRAELPRPSSPASSSTYRPTPSLVLEQKQPVSIKREVHESGDQVDENGGLHPNGESAYVNSCQGGQRFSSNEEFDDGGSQAEREVLPVVEAGWISDGDDMDRGEPLPKMKRKFKVGNVPLPQMETTRLPQKDETIKDIVRTMMENTMRHDRTLMEAENAHRRMEAERHSEEIRLLRDQIQLERDRLQFEREERERMEIIRREEAARNERLRREEMERTEKARLDDREREERRFTLMMALIKGVQSHSGSPPS